MRSKLLASALLLAATVVACSTPSGPSDRQVPRDSPVATEHPFELKGTVKSVSGGILGMGESLTVARDRAPSAQLRVADRTHITLDDRLAKLSELREGDEVRVLFDFDGAAAVAIDVTAKAAKRR